jgi:peptidoglycan/LPS O-acetylase OafA/YrhL
MGDLRLVQVDKASACGQPIVGLKTPIAILDSSTSSLLRPYYPSLDGLRAVAILLVFLIHFGEPVWHWKVLRFGWVGVDLFFVLSGFLITGIIYDTLHKNDFFRSFYIRRTLRLFPLYYAFWIVLFVAGLTPWIRILWNRYDLTMVAYLGNFFIPGGLLGHHADVTRLFFQQRYGDYRGFIALGPLWSLCVEEQFYLIWPAILWWVRSRRALLWICVSIIVAEPVFRIFYLHWRPSMLYAEGLYSTTFCRADTLLVGAAVALWLRGANPTHALVRTWAYVLVFGGPFLLALALVCEGHITGRSLNPHLIEDPVIVTVGFTLVALTAAGLLLLSIDNESLVARILHQPVLLWIGRISYGLYLIHGPVSVFFVMQLDEFHRYHLAFVDPILGSLTTVGLAWLSFRFIESPFLRLKPRLAPRSGAADDPPPYLQPQQVE